MLGPWNPGQRSVKVTDSGTIRLTGYRFLLVFCSNFVPMRYSTCKYTVTLKPGLGINQDHRNWHGLIRHLWFSINIPTMGLSHTVSEINCDFSQNRKIFPPPLCILHPAEGVPIGIGYRRWGSKNQNDVATGLTKKFDDIFSRLDRMHERDRETDGHRATARTPLTHSVAR